MKKTETSGIQFNLEEYAERVVRYFGKEKENEDFFLRALHYAYDLHRGVSRQSGEPYISHPCAVAEIILKEFRLRDSQLLAAALLHDVVEDVPNVSIKNIEQEFGLNVAEIVDGCTKLRYLGADRALIKDLTHGKIFLSASNKPEVLIVKLADRLHNLRTLKFLQVSKRQRIARETVDVYAPIAAQLNIYPLKRELYQLSLSHLFPRKSRHLLAELKQLKKKEIIATIKQDLSQALTKYGIQAGIRSRVKGLGNYYDPVKKTLDRANAEDRIDFVITSPSESLLDCYKILGVLNLSITPLPRTLRDFIAHPKSNGYRSLHTRSNISGENFLFKIRTPEMDLFATHGILGEWEKRGQVSRETWQEILEIFRSIGEYSGGSSKRKEIIRAAEGEEIIIYTPKGDIKYLPRGAIVLDFAYRIHTEVGNRCIGARIGSKTVGPGHSLNDGDIVEIITSPQSTRITDPNLEKLARTAKTRVNINRKINQELREFAATVGESILKQEINHYNLPVDILKSEKASLVLEFMNLKNLTELFIKIGQDFLKPRVFIYYFVNLNEGRAPRKKPRQPNLKTRQKRNKVYVDNLDTSFYKFSQCCHPYPGQQGVIGLLSERGISFHRENCFELIRYKVDSLDMLDIIWDPETSLKNYLVRIRFPKTNPNTLFKLLAGIDHHVVIQDVKTEKSGRLTSQMVLNMIVQTIADLAKTMEKLESENNIITMQISHA